RGRAGGRARLRAPGSRPGAAARPARLATPRRATARLAPHRPARLPATTRRGAAPPPAAPAAGPRGPGGHGLPLPVVLLRAHRPADRAAEPTVVLGKPRLLPVRLVLLLPVRLPV